MSLLEVHAKLSFQKLAPFLGLSNTKYTVNAKCPYCGSYSWSVCQDNRNLEEWHYCSQCKVSGSVLAMAADCLEVPETEILDVLLDRLGLTITDNDRSDFENTRKYRKQFKFVWAEAQENMKFLRQPEYQYLYNMGWQKPAAMGLERFIEGPCQLFGMLKSETANAYLGSVFSKSSRPMLAIVPYFINSTVIGGFACFPKHREIFVTCHRDNKEFCLPGEIGFAGLQLLDQLQSKHVIVTSMLSPMIMLQMKNFNTSKVPLPILSSRYEYGTLSETQWSSLGGRNLILWEHKPTSAMLHQAMMTNANIAFLGPNKNRDRFKESIGTRYWNWVHHEPAVDTLNKIIRTARPFEHTLNNWSRLAPWEEKIELLKDAEQYSTPVYDLVHRSLKPGFNSEFGRRITVPTRSRSSDHLVGYTVVIERQGQWFNRTGHVRLAGILRVEHILIRENSREYVGYLKTDKKQINFQVPVKNANWSYLNNLLIENEILPRSGRLVLHSSNNQKNENFCPFDAACRFEPPTIVRGLEKIGWDGEGFQFRRSRLINGVFHSIPDFTFQDGVPGPQLTRCQLTKDVCTSLARDNIEMEATWALAIALAAQVTAACVGLPTYGILINCSKIDAAISALYNRMEIRRGDYKHWPHGWPRRLDDFKNIKQYESTGFFVTAMCNLKKTINEIIVVDLQKLELQPRLFSYSADKIVLNYLRHFTQLRTKMPVGSVKNWENWIKFTSKQFCELFKFAEKKRLDAALKRISVQ